MTIKVSMLLTEMLPVYIWKGFSVKSDSIKYSVFGISPVHIFKKNILSNHFLYVLNIVE